MITHPEVQIIGGDVYIHDLHLFDDETDDPIDVSGHSFSFKFRTHREGADLNVAGTCVASGTNIVRLTVSAGETTALAANVNTCVYAMRDDTLGITLLEVDARVQQGVAS